MNIEVTFKDVKDIKAADSILWKLYNTFVKNINSITSLYLTNME